MVGPNRLKCKPGFYYEDFITLNETNQKSQAHKRKSTWGLGEMNKRKSNADFQATVVFQQPLSLGGDYTPKP